MKKILIFVLLFTFSTAFGASQLSITPYVEGFESKYKGPQEINDFLSKGGTCSGVINLKSVEDYKLSVRDDIILNSSRIPTDSFTPEQLSQYNEFTQLSSLYDTIKKSNDKINSIKKSYDIKILNKIEDDILNGKSCSSYIGQENSYCIAYTDLRYANSQLDEDKKIRYLVLKDKENEISPISWFYNRVSDGINKSYIQKCNTIKSYSTKQTTKETVVLKPSFSEQDYTDLVKVVRDKYKLMSKAQKDKFLKFLKELK